MQHNENKYISFMFFNEEDENLAVWEDINVMYSKWNCHKKDRQCLSYKDWGDKATVRREGQWLDILRISMPAHTTAFGSSIPCRIWVNCQSVGTCNNRGSRKNIIRMSLFRVDQCVSFQNNSVLGSFPSSDIMNNLQDNFIDCKVLILEEQFVSVCLECP